MPPTLSAAATQPPTPAATAAESPPRFEEVPYREVERALAAGDLAVCEFEADEGDMSGSYESRSYDLGSRCDALVTVDRYASPGEVARAAGMVIDGFGSAIMTFQKGDVLVALFGGVHPSVHKKFERAMKELNAVQIDDRRQ